MEINDKLSAILFYKEQEEDCFFCDEFWNIYLKVAKKFKNLVKFYVLDCDLRVIWENQRERTDYTVH